MTGPERPGGSVRSLRTLARRERLRDQVREALRAAIISGELTPDTVYSAPALGSRFGVSATPVREAMLDLVQEGLVVSQPNKGFLITEISAADLDQLAAVRLLLEPPTVREVVARLDTTDVARLRTLAQDIVDAADRGDLIAYTEADHVFHLSLLERLGNRYLVDVVARLRSQTRLLGLTRLRDNGTLNASAAEHLELMDLAEAGDAAGAEQLMRRHIGHIRGLWANGS